MIITCEACNTSFNLDDKMLKATGSKVRCSVCSNVFTAFPQQAPAPESPAEEVETDAAPETKPGPEPDLAAASALASAIPDTPAAADTPDGHTPETGIIDEDADALFADTARRDDVPGLTTLRHARIPADRADEYRRRLLDLALEFVDEPRDGDVEFGLYLALYPTTRSVGPTATMSEEDRP